MNHINRLKAELAFEQARADWYEQVVREIRDAAARYLPEAYHFQNIIGRTEESHQNALAEANEAYVESLRQNLSPAEFEKVMAAKHALIASR